MAMTMTAFLTRTYDDNKDNANAGNERPRFLRQQPILVGCIPGRGVSGWVISTMMTTMRMMTMATTMAMKMRTFLRRMYDDDNNDEGDSDK